jgi:outer membrane lipoprotein
MSALSSIRVGSVLLSAWLVLGLLGSCASKVPQTIRDKPRFELSIPQIQAEPDIYRGYWVRWGGTIASLENQETDTWIEVVSRPLRPWGRPRTSDTSQGRFLARVREFLDPAIYTSGRELTVSGTVDGLVTRSIGEFPYRFPVIDVSVHHLWEPDSPESYRWGYCDSFWDLYGCRGLDYWCRDWRFPRYRCWW